MMETDFVHLSFSSLFLFIEMSPRPQVTERMREQSKMFADVQSAAILAEQQTVSLKFVHWYWLLFNFAPTRELWGGVWSWPRREQLREMWRETQQMYSKRAGENCKSTEEYIPVGEFRARFEGDEYFEINYFKCICFKLFLSVYYCITNNSMLVASSVSTGTTCSCVLLW